MFGKRTRQHRSEPLEMRASSVTRATPTGGQNAEDERRSTSPSRESALVRRGLALRERARRGSLRTMSAHELGIARQLIALAPLLRGDWFHVHFAVRPALFEAAVGLADLLRPELGEDVHVPLFEGTDEDGRDYKLWLRLDNEAEYNRRHAGCAHTNCCPSVERGRNESMRRRAACEYVLDDGRGPCPWDGLYEFRAVRIWQRLARVLIKYRSSKTFEQEDGTHKPVIDPETLARLRMLIEGCVDAMTVGDKVRAE